MSRNYDNWEKLVGAILRRAKDRHLAYCESFDSFSSADASSRFSIEISFAGDDHQLASEVCRSGGPKIDEYNSGIFFSHNVRPIKYEEIRKAIGDFRDHYVFGKRLSYNVYEGWIDEQSLAAVQPGFGIHVAFKIKWLLVFKDIEIHKKKWLEEISHLRHPNLDTPIGYCFDSGQMIFAYELMDKGSLSNCLFQNKLDMDTLPWATIMKVAVGAARGLAFLHGLKTPVIYGNLTIDDILLDSGFNARLRGILPVEDLMKKKSFYESYDFNYHLQIIHKIENCVYTAPEYKATGNLSTKCDVYSFGVVLLELVLGLRALDRDQAVEMHNRVNWAAEFNWGSKERLLQIVDSRLKGRYRRKQASKVAHIAAQCVSSNPRSRPKMAHIVDELQRMLFYFL